MRSIPVSAALAAILCGCSTFSVPALGAGPARVGDPRALDDTVEAAIAAGYRPLSIDGERGRFEVIAESDRSGETRFVVQCFSNGWISIVPRGPTVEREGARFRMSGTMRTEYAAFAEEIDHRIGVRP